MSCLLFSQRIYRKQFVKVAIRLKSLLAVGISVLSTPEQPFNLGLFREISITEGNWILLPQIKITFDIIPIWLWSLKYLTYQFLSSSHYVEISILHVLNTYLSLPAISQIKKKICSPFLCIQEICIGKPRKWMVFQLILTSSLPAGQVIIAKEFLLILKELSYNLSDRWETGSRHAVKMDSLCS